MTKCKWKIIQAYKGQATTPNKSQGKLLPVSYFPEYTEICLHYIQPKKLEKKHTRFFLLN